MRIFEGYQKGINLGGWFSQCDHSENRYDTFISDADFAEIKRWGADHVRVPIDYELLETKDAQPREDGYRRLEHTVALCRENGLNMVLDLHKTAGFSFDANEGEAGFFDSERYQERFYSLWERIAKRFRNDTDLLAFELLNEVTEKAYCDTWNRIAAECIRRIRAIAPTVKILVGGYWHNSAVYRGAVRRKHRLQLPLLRAADLHASGRVLDGNDGSRVPHPGHGDLCRAAGGGQSAGHALLRRL